MINIECLIRTHLRNKHEISSRNNYYLDFWNKNQTLNKTNSASSPYTSQTIQASTNLIDYSILAFFETSPKIILILVSDYLI